MYSSRKYIRDCSAEPNPRRSAEVANKPKPVRAQTPKVRPPGFTDGAWEFPIRLARLANRKGWFVKDLMRISGLQQPALSKWRRHQVAEPDRMAVRAIEIEAKIPVGELLKEPEDGTQPPRDVVVTQLEEWADRLGLDESLVGTLTNDQLSMALGQFNRQIRGAILGLVHVHRVPLDRALAIAQRVRKEHPRMVNSPDGTELYWFGLMALEAGRKESGQFPSSGHIKLVE
jgi:transcriptional regulator with XRE-family HTH domain